MTKNEKKRSGLFVVQKHLGRRTCFDLRLELGGTLKSWAIPRGPSFDPAVERMAVLVEDQPLESADFEGAIPGEGSVIIWDKGTWTAFEDAGAALVEGRIQFELSGFKLRGAWSLERTKESERDWLFKKLDDVEAR